MDLYDNILNKNLYEYNKKESSLNYSQIQTAIGLLNFYNGYKIISVPLAKDWLFFCVNICQ